MPPVFAHCVYQTDEYLRLLAVLPFKTCVFLKLLSLSSRSFVNAERFHLFLSPTLRHCVLPALDAESNFFGTRCPVKEKLCVWRLADLALLSDTIHSCKRLVHLSCPPLDSAAWKHLSALDTLITLHIDGTYRSLDRNNLKFTPFLNVTALSFDLDTVTGIITLLQHSDFPSLKKFELKVSTTGLFLGEIKQLFGALSQCNTRRSLEYIDISESCLWSQVRKDSTLIRQLFCFTQLQTLSLYFYGPIYLDNEFLLEAMSSWPHMRSLRLTDWSCCRQLSVTFGGLSAALRLGLHLHTLYSTVDAVNIDIDPEAEQFQHTSLKSLHLLSSPIEDAKVVARVVSLVFPCVDEVVANTEVIPTWIAVNDHLQSSKTSALFAASQE